jgi:hypothetical protein
MKKTDLIEVFRTKSGCVYQCDASLVFWIEFAGHFTPFKFPCFLSLKKLVDRINVAEMIANPRKSADFEIINPCGSERIFVLSATEVIEFQELLAGAKVMMQLNSIIKEKLNVVIA